MDKVKEHFCLNCEHLWHDFDVDNCPECGSVDIERDERASDDGHYEGDMRGAFPSNKEIIAE